MPFNLDDTDIAILKSLQEDGRKSFRQISREIKVSTPTIKARYERLVSIGLIKSVKPEFDLSKIGKLEKDQLTEDNIQNLKEQNKHFHVKIDNLKVTIKCDLCEEPTFFTITVWCDAEASGIISMLKRSVSGVNINAKTKTEINRMLSFTVYANFYCI